MAFNVGAEFVPEGADAGKVEVALGNSRFYLDPNDARKLSIAIDRSIVEAAWAASGSWKPKPGRVRFLDD